MQFSANLNDVIIYVWVVSLCRWRDRSGLVIGPSGNIHVNETDLIFERPQEMDSGNYTAIIRNIAGEKLQKVWIIVSGNYTHITYMRLRT